MALATLEDLTGYVLAKLDRTDDPDAQAQADSWVTLAETELRIGLGRLRVRQGETYNNAFSISSEFTALPDGFFGVRQITLQGTTPRELEWVPPTVSDKWNIGTTGKPKFACIQGNQLRVAPAPDGTYTANFAYYALPSLVVNDTNWLMTNYPKVYVSATLAEAYDYYENEAKYEAAGMERERLLSAIYGSEGAGTQVGTLQAYVRTAP